MAKQDGKKFRIWIGAALSEVMIPLEVTSSLSIENAIIDASDKDSGGWLTGIDGQRSWNADTTLNYDSAEAGQLDLIDKLIDTTTSTEVEVLIGENNESGDISWRSKALIASANISGDNASLITMDISLTGNDALVKVVKAP